MPLKKGYDNDDDVTKQWKEVGETLRGLMGGQHDQPRSPMAPCDDAECPEPGTPMHKNTGTIGTKRRGAHRSAKEPVSWSLSGWE